MANRVWEDREIKFDIPNIHKKLRNGENILEIIDSVEDTKGNSGDLGQLVITNIRLIWFSLTNTKFTLSIGFFTIVTMNTKNVISTLRGSTDALYILTSTPKQRFEFIFTDYGANQKHFGSLFEIYKIYQSTTLYRELKLRGAILTEGHLNILRQEQVYTILNGVYNLSSDQGNLGTFIITNIRLVWYAEANESFNISLPYMQMISLRIRESKYGLALVIQTGPNAGNYVLGFRVDPQEKLHEVHKELISLHSVYSETPIFGVNYDIKALNKTEDMLRIDDISEIDNEASSEINSKFTAYLSEEDREEHREPFYCKELGFAMEKLRDGYTIKDLWNVMGTTTR
ncbi:CLUMA_CG017210, isoform A [Clunio marinus]|uniref:CLUMA_CG017210, isoform A n=1 Tax=Clunio marinus TaxID=568069 RepID=A0A1J1IZT5_9DIPT|nr:CLUMA_CG017210, isoform A [Clunio marinus]